MRRDYAAAVLAVLCACCDAEPAGAARTRAQNWNGAIDHDTPPAVTFACGREALPHLWARVYAEQAGARCADRAAELADHAVERMRRRCRR